MSLSRTHSLHLLPLFFASHTSTNPFHTNRGVEGQHTFKEHSKIMYSYALHASLHTNAKWCVINVVFLVFASPEPSSSPPRLTPCPATNTADNTLKAIRIRFKNTSSKIMTLPHLRTHSPTNPGSQNFTQKRIKNRANEGVPIRNPPLFYALLIDYHKLTPRSIIRVQDLTLRFCHEGKSRPIFVHDLIQAQHGSSQIPEKSVQWI